MATFKDVWAEIYHLHPIFLAAYSISTSRFFKFHITHAEFLKYYLKLRK